MALCIVFNDGDHLLVGEALYVFHTTPPRLTSSSAAPVMLGDDPVPLQGDVTVWLTQAPATHRPALRITAPAQVLIQRIRAEASQ